MASYRIIDEPRPSRWNSIAVSPFWIFLGSLLGGIGIGWAWFLLNGFAFGSPTRRRELTLVAIGVVGVAGLWMGLGHYQASIPEAAIPYIPVLFVAFRLAITYLLHLTQSRGFELYEHFGGQVKNALPVVMALTLLRFRLAGMLGPWAGVIL